MKKASTIEEAFIHIFGGDRLFNDHKVPDSQYNVDIKYILSAIIDSEVAYDYSKFDPENDYLLDRISFNITLSTGFDTRMEMIDFLHYIQHSGLTNPDYFEEPLSEYSVSIGSWYHDKPDVQPDFIINMNVFQDIKPDMNTPEPHQKLSISSDIVEVIDFSDKDSMLFQISNYGTFEGYNPSGTHN